MKKSLRTSLALLVLVTLASSCGTRQNGQLLGVLDRPNWKGINPYGMVYVPSGTLHIGNSDQDITNTFVQRPKSISIAGFYMDDTEITNNEYRQFVYWVQDSLAHDLLDHYYEDERTGDQFIDWDQDIDWEDETLEDLYFQGNDRFAGRKELNTTRMVYEYQWYDWKLPLLTVAARRVLRSSSARRQIFIPIRWYGFATSPIPTTNR